MRLCRELGKTINELMGWTDLNDRILPMTHRQQLMWDAHFDDDWNRPNRSDHYLMQIAGMLIAVNTKDGKGPDYDKLKIPFGEYKKPDPNAYYPPGNPRPIKDQADLNRIHMQMAMAQVSQGRLPGPTGEGFDVPPHPLALKQKWNRMGVPTQQETQDGGE